MLIIIGVLSALGCESVKPESPQPILHPKSGSKVMVVPKGTLIGKIPAPEQGLYIAESVLIELSKKKSLLIEKESS
jgi:hypothetical protein